jgi:hypothetical protein
MATHEPQTQLAPLPLHRSQLAAADATAADMSGGSMGPRVSRAWALRELAVWGCRELAALLGARAPFQLRALNPRRGAPKKGESAGGAKVSAEDFHTVSPLIVPRTLLRDLRALVPKVARATGQQATLAMVVREALLLGHEARERARAAAEEKAREQRALLRLAGYPDPSALRVVGVGVITPYLPPGQRGVAADDWSESPPKARSRVRAKTEVKKPAASSRKRTPTTARTSDRQTPRRRASTTKKTKSGDGDDDPGASPSGAVHGGARP